MSTVIGDRFRVYIVFTGKYAFPETINGVDILRAKEGVLSLYRKKGTNSFEEDGGINLAEEVHLSSYPLCNIKRWVIEE